MWEEISWGKRVLQGIRGFMKVTRVPNSDFA